MKIYITLILVLVSALSSVSSWGNEAFRYDDDFKGKFEPPYGWGSPYGTYKSDAPYKPHRPHFNYRPYKRPGFYMPHEPHVYHIPHNHGREQWKSCHWSTDRKEWGSNKAPRPPPVKKQSVELCMDRCPITRDYNPVCGSDGVRYKNIRSLMCAQNCGIVVSLSTPDVCGIDAIVSSRPTTENAGPLSPTLDIRGCMINCPVTSEYNPVCGSNGVTYANLGRLECAKMCGIDVQLSRNSRCLVKKPGRVTSTSNTNESPKPTPPIPVTTSTPVPLTNATPKQNTPATPVNVPVTPVYLSVTPVNVRVTPVNVPVTPVNVPVTPVNEPVTNSDARGSIPRFTIPQNVLDQIFTTDYSGLINERRGNF